MSYQEGLITLDEPLTYYHWGAGSSTEKSHNGVDMRGEVVLLSRNVIVEGEDFDAWGGQIMATDMFEASGAWRKGSIAFDSVEVRKCSQRNTYKAAIRFDNAMGGWSTIKNSVVHDSLAWSVSI